MGRAADAERNDCILADRKQDTMDQQQSDESLDWILAELCDPTGATSAILVEENGDRLTAVAGENDLLGEQMLAALVVSRRSSQSASDNVFWIDASAYGLNSLLRVPVLIGGDRNVCALLSFVQRPDIGAHGTAAKLRPFVSSLRPYLRLWQRLRSERRHAVGLKAALDQQEGGVFLLASDGHLLFRNSDGDRLLQAHDGLRERHNALSATELGDAVRLQVVIDHVLNANRIGTSGASRAALPILLIRRSGDLPPLVVAVVALDREAHNNSDPAAILFALRPEKDTTNRITPICQLHGLSPVETRLVCHLVAGMTMCEAAIVMRIKQLTARTYLKQIFLKTGAKRQAELIRLMMASLLPLTGVRSFQTV